MVQLTLYTNFRSSCAHRVRIALALKGLEFESSYVDLRRESGGNRDRDERHRNAPGLVPTLLDGQRVLTQSLAIIEYLDELYPDPPLLPEDVRDRAYVRALTQIVASDIQPPGSLRVLAQLQQRFGADERQQRDWCCHWIAEGLQAVEVMLETHDQASSCCCTDAPTLADVCLIPQVDSAKRLGCDVSPYRKVMQIYDHCMTLPAFQAAAPERQGDAAAHP